MPILAQRFEDSTLGISGSYVKRSKYPFILLTQEMGGGILLFKGAGYGADNIKQEADMRDQTIAQGIAAGSLESVQIGEILIFMAKQHISENNDQAEIGEEPYLFNTIEDLVLAYTDDFILSADLFSILCRSAARDRRFSKAVR